MVLGNNAVRAVRPRPNECHRMVHVVSIYANAIWSNSIRAELILVVCVPVGTLAHKINSNVADASHQTARSGCCG